MADGEADFNLPVITAFSFKGGAGKTTLLALLGSAALASGYRVIFIDTDSTKNLTTWQGTAVQNGYWPDTAQLHHTLDEDRVTQIIDDAYDTRSADLVLLDTPGFATKALDQLLAVSDFVMSPLQLSQPDAVSAAATRDWMQAFYLRLGAGAPRPAHCFVANNVKNLSRLSVTERKYLDRARADFALVKTMVPHRATLAMMTDKGPLGEIIKHHISEEHEGARITAGHSTDLLELAMQVMNDVLPHNVWEAEDA